MATLTLRPNAAGDICNVPFQIGDACPDHYKNVDEVTPDEGTTQVYSAAYSHNATPHDLYNIENHTTEVGAITNVRVYARMRDNATNRLVDRAYLHMKTGGTNYFKRFTLTTSWANYYEDWAINPQTSLAWTWDDIDALQIGLGLFNPRRPSSGWSGKYEYCTQMWIEVTHVVIVAPAVTTDPATGVGTNAATLNGTLDNDGGEACDCGFEWGETIAYGNTTPTQSRTTGQTFSQAITGLSPGVTYHFRAIATNSAGTSYGSDETFTTLTDPTTTTNPATSLEKTAATLNGTLDDDGNEACDCGFEYGETTAYGTTTPTESKNTGETFSQDISDLTPGKHYHFRAIATNSAGTSYGSNRQFFAKLKGGNPNIDQLIYQHVERMER